MYIGFSFATSSHRIWCRCDFFGLISSSALLSFVDYIFTGFWYFGVMKTFSHLIP
ncbi:hypothetical protein HanRHA438_Chr02g0093121 [Helianthus annuus]|nr:hypothetical protein HanRHA438_Chr02g0093121 [Helianthus annuus]